VPAAGEAPAIAAAPAPAQPAVEVASAERSVGDSKAIESFLRDDYLAPDADRLPDMVRRLYADPATLYGQPMSLDAIVKAKADWFAQWSGWTLSLEPGSLEVTPRGEDGADVRFTMRYDYAPKAAGAAHAAGRARVALSLARRDGGWRIASESSEAMP
jgi:uncharacterized caspase-like protein